MKKIIFTVIIGLMLASNVFAAELDVQNETLTKSSVMDEDGGHTYTFVKPGGDHGIINVGENRIVINVFSSEGVLRQEKTLSLNGSKFGGYITDGTYHYFLFGNDNPSCSESATIYKLVKYNQSFTKMSTASFKGYQILAKDIFLGEGGTADMRISDNLIFINDVVTEYKTENKYYKNNRSIIIDKNTFRYCAGIGGMALRTNDGIRNEVTRILSATDDDKYYFAVNSAEGIDVITVDPSDSSSLGAHTIQSISRTKLSAYYPDMTMVAPKSGTALTLDGFEVGKDSFITVGSEISYTGRKLFVSTVSKKQIGGVKSKTVYLTDEGDISNIKTIKVSDDDIMIMWNENDIIHCICLDGKGALKTEEKQIFDVMLGNTLPFACDDGSLCWTYMINDDDFAFYTYKRS